jgi:hypothetical protein
MFDIAGVKNMTSAFEEARKRPTGVRTLLERVSHKATEHIRRVWDGFASLAIELHENGDRLDCVIRDIHGTFAFHQRSDGFRRFVSFLLMISTRASAGQFKNALLLYDEPDTSLHPSGARQLRDELLRLSKTNQVVFSTHSIFMVDPNEIERHLVVKRSNEVTTVERVEAGNIANEEVLYQAIGHSIFDILKPLNLILEGYRDKQLFDIALSASDDATHTFFRKVGRCHAGGVKNIPTVVPMIELADRAFFIVTDGDQVAVSKQQEYRDHWRWKTYVEYVGAPFVTAEDFVQPEPLKVAIDAAAEEFAELGAVRSLDPTKPFMAQLDSALKAVEWPRRKIVLKGVKDRIFDRLVAEHLRPEAMQLVASIKADLEAMENRAPLE